MGVSSYSTALKKPVLPHGDVKRASVYCFEPNDYYDDLFLPRLSKIIL